MWWEALPGFLIIVGATAVANFGITGVQKLTNGGMVDRLETDEFFSRLYLRDERIAGDQYTIKFLEDLD